MTTKKTHKLCVLMPSYNKGSYKRSHWFCFSTRNKFWFSTHHNRRCIEWWDIRCCERNSIKTPKWNHIASFKKNQGLLSNIIKAYKEMKCEYFCVLDPDDYYTDTKFLQKAVDFLDKNKEFSIYASDVMIIDAYG